MHASRAGYCYVVRCTFAPAASPTAKRWLEWLRDKHLAEVLAAGALDAQIVRIDGPVEQYEIHYRFADKAGFEVYERDHAPRLREEGLARFPLNLGLEFERRSGAIIHAQENDQG